MITNLYLARDHGCDNISTKIIKICSESLTALFRIIFEQPLKEGIFPEIWKKANVVPVKHEEHKKPFKK